jgi:phage gp45-like
VQKKEVLSSIFPQKLQIDENNCRTYRVNEALQLTLAAEKGSGHKKTGQLFKNTELSGNVEMTGQKSNRLLENFKALAKINLHK